MKVKSESEVAQSCPTLRDPMDCSLPGSSLQEIFQARVLEWGAIAFSVFKSKAIKIRQKPQFFSHSSHISCTHVHITACASCHIGQCISGVCSTSQDILMGGVPQCTATLISCLHVHHGTEKYLLVICKSYYQVAECIVKESWSW